MTGIRDRIKDFRRVKASELVADPLNPRTHPPLQKNTLRAVLEEIGYVDALICRERDDGRLQLIDGHLRAETTPDSEVPVLIVDVTEEEAKKVLATFDPIGGMAGLDTEKFGELVAQLDTKRPEIQAMLDSMKGESEKTGHIVPDEVDVPSVYIVSVECGDESQQKALYERLTAEGHKCNAQTL